MYDPKVTIVQTVRHVWSAREQLDIGFEYEDSWEDEKGTFFQVFPLARTHDSYDYMMTAYPYGFKKPPYHMVLAWTRRITGHDLVSMYLPQFIHTIQADVDYFTSVFYNYERTNAIPYTSDGKPPVGGKVAQRTKEPYWDE